MPQASGSLQGSEQEEQVQILFGKVLIGHPLQVKACAWQQDCPGRRADLTDWGTHTTLECSQPWRSAEEPVETWIWALGLVTLLLQSLP